MGNRNKICDNNDDEQIKVQIGEQIDEIPAELADIETISSQTVSSERVYIARHKGA